MRILIITSEDLHPRDTHTCSFELSLAGALANAGTEVNFLSVYLVTPKNLLKALLVKASFGLKANRIAARFSMGMLLRLAFGYFLFRRKKAVLTHRIQGMSCREGIGIHPFEVADLEAFEPAWVDAGRAAFEKIPSGEQPDIIHAHSRFYLAASLANDLRHRFGIPYVVTEHSSYYFRGLIPESMIPAVRKAYEESSAATAVSRVLAEKVRQVLQTNTPVRVIGNVLSEVYTAPLPAGASGRANKGFTVISVGRLDENKNQQLLIRAFARAAIPGSQLVITGEGPLQTELSRLATSLHIEGQVVFTGRLPREAVRERMLRSDVLVVSSKVETFSVVVAEAQACGLPAISTPCGGPAELIGPDSGILLSSFEEEEMTRALLQMHAHPDSYPSSAIRNKVLAAFGPAAVAERYNSLFGELMNKKI